MKPSLIIIVLAVVVLLAFPAVMAASCHDVIVDGVVTLKDDVTPVIGANVTVLCNNIEKHTTSVADGFYGVFYNNSIDCGCTLGNAVDVTAVSDKGSGSNEGTVTDPKLPAILNLDIAVVDVSIPEFGVIASGLAMLGAIFGIAIFRKR